MAKRLTTREKKKIIADYVEMENYSAVSRKYGISRNAVKAIVLADAETAEKCQRKKEKDTEDILAHMESKKEMVNKIIDKYLVALLDDEKIAKAQPQQLTTALGTIIDKFTMVSKVLTDNGEPDALSESLEDMGKELTGD